MDKNFAFNTVKSFVENTDNVIVKNAILALHPELAESEDERIRKALLRCCDDWEKGQFGCMAKEDIPAIRAYLEKQKEHKPTAEEVLVKAGLRPYRDGNQWCILVGDNIQEGVCGFGDTIEDALYNFLIEVLDLQKEQKPAEWSEEDEVKKNAIADWLAAQGFAKYNGFEAFQLMRWLDSLSPQLHWKPSEVQLRCLEYAINSYESYEAKHYELQKLYDDLKKLL